MHNMQDELSGPMAIEFLNGDKKDVIIDSVVVDKQGQPIYLAEEDNVIHNWSTITRVTRK